MIELNENLFESIHDEQFNEYLDYYDFDKDDLLKVLSISTIEKQGKNSLTTEAILKEVCKDLGLDIDEEYKLFNRDNELPLDHELNEEEKKYLLEYFIDDYYSDLLDIYEDDIEYYIENHGGRTLDEYKDRMEYEYNSQMREQERAFHNYRGY